MKKFLHARVRCLVFAQTMMCLGLVGAVGLAGQSLALENVVNESAREIPLIHEADVVVLGGGVGAVSAAVSAAETGARVFLAAPFPYLGDDLTATLQLWLEDGESLVNPLARRIYADPQRKGVVSDGLDTPRPAPRPHHVKKELDTVLIEAGVKFVYSSMPTELLRDEAGHPAGVVMANRAGRQAVIAPVIIDATLQASLARLAGIEFRPYPAGTHTFRQTVIGGEVQTGENLTARVGRPAGSGPWNQRAP